jgi:hypothetical protein
MKGNMIAALILLITIALLPVSMVRAQEETNPATSTSSANPPSWDLTKPASCSVVGPPPCQKCTVTCEAGHQATCTPGESALKGSANSCVRPTSCVCK